MGAQQVIYPLLYRHAIMPIMALRDVEERNMSAHLRELEKTQWLTREDLIRKSETKLRKLVQHAATSVPYYRSLFQRLRLDPRDIRQIKDLQQLPPLTKEILGENLEALTTPGTEGVRLRHQTGGSTGEPTILYVDNRTRKSWSRAACLRAWEWAGWRSGEKMCNLWGSYLDRPTRPPITERLYHLSQRTSWLDAFALSEEALPSMVDRLRRLRPVALRGYASALYVMGRYVLENSIQDVRPRLILTTTEKLYDRQRSTIEKAFGCPVFDYYGNRETNLIASECPEHKGYHVALENALIEVVRDGVQVPAGESGDLLITDLCNFITPLLRYEVGDQVRVTGQDCPCGRGLPVIDEILGRSHDIIVTAEGGYIHGELFTHAFWDCAWVKKFQIVQESIGHLGVLLVGEPKGHEDDLETALAYLRRYVGAKMTIDVNFVSDIPQTRAGKFRFVVSKIHDSGRTAAIGTSLEGTHDVR
ncbi:MAG: hypothetical protein L0Z52_11355 [Acidobacteria bacterium]|nr:hypothetical protein [Acidobacteriota bacterium]